MNAVLDMTDLSVDVATASGSLRVLDSVELRIDPGEIVCLVGESGSGKTVTALSIVRLVDFQGGVIRSGRIRFEGRDLTHLSRRDMNLLRGGRIGFVFQEPMTAFDPLFTIGSQIVEVIRRHKGIGAAAARAEAIALLRRVHISNPTLRIDQYPHELSGGMRQRAMIAVALACEPQLLIADEPTTALDVTVQAEILALLRELRAEGGMAILLITHDLGVAAEMADRVVVMYAGRVIEDAAAADIFDRPAHPYTRGLLRSVVIPEGADGEPLHAIPGAVPDLASPPAGCRFHPRCPRCDRRCETERPPLALFGRGRVACWNPHDSFLAAAPPAAATPAADAVNPERAALVQVRDLRKHYRLGRWNFGQHRFVRAVDGVSFDILNGETFGLVGESGSGKSTLARLLLRLERPDGGLVVFDGRDLTVVKAASLRRVRRDMQAIFQDPYGSVDPRWTVGEIVAEPLTVHERLDPAARRARVEAALEQVGIDPSWHGRYPHQLSGGQRQRVATARAVITGPRLVVADEALSALDVSVRAQIVNLLRDLKERLGLTYLFIGHGLDVVHYMSDRVGIMYRGRLVEVGPADPVFRRPAHPYTRALLAAIPQPVSRPHRLTVRSVGDVSDVTEIGSGCSFHPRCPNATRRCRQEAPVSSPLDGHRTVACHHPL
jgi:peptide/nickel transport system ATP-binding protein